MYSSGYASGSEDMNAQQQYFYYNGNGNGSASMMGAPQVSTGSANNSGPTSPPTRRRMHNPYSSSNPVVMVNAVPSSSTPMMSPVAAYPMMALNVTSGAAVPMELLSLAQAPQSSSSAASSTGSVAPIQQMPTVAVPVVQQQQQQQERPRHNKHHGSSKYDSSYEAPAPSASTPSPYTGMTGDEMFADLSARPEADVLQLARSANGSSMLQTAIKGDVRCAKQLWDSLCCGATLGELMLDAHGGYVVRALLDSVPREQARAVCDAISRDTRLAYSLCTHSLHTRRLVQGIMETHDSDFLSSVLTEMCNEIARTQQGCIVMQRALDHSSAAPRAALVMAISKHLGGFSADPFANYVVQYLLDSAPREEVVPLLWSSLRGHVLALSCNKFASNVIEKFLVIADPQSQHELIIELYTSAPEALCHVMQDSFGNYIVQATIARSTFADLTFIDSQLRPILEHVPYGSKIAARLDRRLNPNHQGGANRVMQQQQQQQQQQHNAMMQQQQHQQQQMTQQQHQQAYMPRGRGGRYQHNGGYYQQQQQQQQQPAMAAQGPHHGAVAMTYYVTPATAAW